MSEKEIAELLKHNEKCQNMIIGFGDEDLRPAVIEYRSKLRAENPEWSTTDVYYDIDAKVLLKYIELCTAKNTGKC